MFDVKVYRSRYPLILIDVVLWGECTFVRLVVDVIFDDNVPPCLMNRYIEIVVSLISESWLTLLWRLFD